MSDYHKKKTLKMTIARCKKANRAWRKKVLQYAKPLQGKLGKTDWKRLEALLGLRAYSGPIRASDLDATRKFGLLAADVVHSYWSAAKNLRWFHITLLADEFQLMKRSPTLLLKRLKGKAYKEIQDLSLNALFWLDVDPLPNHPQGGKGGTFLFHVHALCFTEKDDFDIDKARKKLEGSRSWSCCLDAKPTDLKDLSEKGTAAWWAQYGAKPPSKAKNVIAQADGSIKLHWTLKGYRPQIAMRLLEGLSQIALMDTLSAVGEGKDLREEIRRKLMEWHRGRWSDQKPVKRFDVRSFFKRLWLTTRVKKYKSWRIVGASI